MKLIGLLFRFAIVLVLPGCVTGTELRQDVASVSSKWSVTLPATITHETTVVIRPLPSPTPALSGTVTLIQK